MVAALLRLPIHVPLPLAALPANHSNRATGCPRGQPARSLAPLRHSPPQTSSVALHVSARLLLACAPGLQRPTTPSAAPRWECCKRNCQVPAGPKTIDAPAHATTATAARATLVQAAASSGPHH